MLRSRLSLSFVALMVMAVLASAPPAAAEQIAYQCEGDICLIDPDNPSTHTDLTNTAGSTESFPQWSPLGNVIAYTALYPQPGNETGEIYTIDPAEAPPREATDVSQTNDRDELALFDWSPDGTRIAFGSHPVSSANPLKDEVYVSRADGASPPVAIGSSAADEGAPQFSPDGNTVAFFRNNTIYTAPADGTGSPAPLPIPSYGTLWSPDGRYMIGERYATYPYGLVVSKVDGSGSHELEKPVDSASAIDWSCDSTRVTYVADEEPNLDQVWVAPADGSSIGVQIPMPPGWVVPHNPKFSPDGARVAFDARPESGPGYEQLLVAPSDGSGPAVPITSDAFASQQPSWKPGPACAGQVPPAISPGGAGGGGTGSTGAGATSGGNIPVTQTPIKLKLSFFNHPVISGHFMTLVSIDCHAEGGHPTGKVAEFCAAAANAKATGVVPQTAHRRAKPKTAQILFAKGSVRVPVGESKNLKLRITPAGRKLLKPGKTLTLKISITTRQGTSKPVTKKRTVKVKVPPKK